MTREKAIVLIECSANELRETLKETTMPSSVSEQLQMYIDAYEMAISALRQQDHFREVTKKVEPLTNAQKIRAMSDEELAWELMLWRCEAVARNHGISSEYPDTQQTILKWLQQPAGEEDKHEAD